MKTRSFLIGLVSFLVGLILGSVAESLYLNRTFKISETGTATSTVLQVPNYQFSQDQINNLTAFVPGNVLNGKVGKKDDNGITLDFWLYNALNPSANKSIPVQIPFNSSVDKVMRLNVVKAAMTKVPASYNDIKTGDYISVVIVKDYKEFDLPPVK